MKIGTKSVLFGAHCFFLHPFFVAWGWYRLYGFKRVKIGTEHIRREYWGILCDEWTPVTTSLLSARLWFAFFLHDIGYIGAADMDGVEGKAHPFLGARMMGALFGDVWQSFTLRHSRSTARWLHVEPSPLCHADKLAYPLTPRWLYLAQVNLTGEIDEYMANANIPNVSRAAQHYWHATVSDSLTDFAVTHR
jgi:hypothetical protein